MGFEGRMKVKAKDGSKDQLIESLAAMDTDGDCRLSWDEFRKALCGPWDEEDDEPELPPPPPDETPWGAE